MRAIINFRGTSGSGKTTLARNFLNALPVLERVGGVVKKHDYYLLDATRWSVVRPIALIGSYENTCGGLDGCGTKEEVMARVEHAREEHGAHVLMEGLILSGIGSKGYITQACAALGHYWPLFLDTSLEDCLAAVRARRVASGRDPEFNPENTAAKHRACVNTMRDFDTVGIPYRVIDRLTGHRVAFSIIQEVERA